MLISVITPAHNEEAFIGDCVLSVSRAASMASADVEHLVVLNRCTDRTQEIAASLGAKIVVEDARNLSRIRNAGVESASGDIIVTIDADSTMSPNMLVEVERMMSSSSYVGGGVKVRLERWSVGIFCSLVVVLPFIVWHGVSAGMFWCRKKDFDEIGGFDESLNCVEDVDFGKRLKSFGKSDGRRYGTIRAAHITTSCRKFDQFGDWYFVRNPRLVFDIFRRQPKAADEFYYNARKG